MPNIAGSVRELHVLDKLASGNTVVHRLHPLAKIICAFSVIIPVVSFGRYDFIRLIPYMFYPFIMMAMAEIPYGILLKRLLIALPFCLFAGITNVFLDNAAAFNIGAFSVSYGLLSLLTILIKMYLTVMAALLLVSTTPFTELTAQLRRLRVPTQLVMIFELTFRYIGVLLLETHTMSVAYSLRSGGKRALQMKHFGSFAGMLLLRGFDKAERIHGAMRCRGYSLRRIQPPRRAFRAADFAVILAVLVPAIMLRIFKIY